MGQTMLQRWSTFRMIWGIFLAGALLMAVVPANFSIIGHSITFVHAAAASCAEGAPSAVDPCCTSIYSPPLFPRSWPDWSWDWFNIRSGTLGCDSKELIQSSLCRICLTSQDDETVAAAEQQARVERFVSRFDSLNCWSGAIAQSPGVGVYQLSSKTEFEAMVVRYGCRATWPVHGGWTQWSNWSPCVNGFQSMSRSCTNPSPARQGNNCTGESLQGQACRATLQCSADQCPAPVVCPSQPAAAAPVNCTAQTSCPSCPSATMCPQPVVCPSRSELTYISSAPFRSMANIFITTWCILFSLVIYV